MFFSKMIGKKIDMEDETVMMKLKQLYTTVSACLHFYHLIAHRFVAI